MNCCFIKLYLELAKWRDEEIRMGNMMKAKQIQKVIRRKMIEKNLGYYC